MKKALLVSLVMLGVMIAVPCFAATEPEPETIVEKMSVKFARGVANTFTFVAELPKQTILSVRDMGGVGYVYGPLKGIGMTVYRGIIGITETVFFGVPQPGYYDPMITPAYVWEGWEPKKDTSPIVADK